jgi:hypothetical protein
MRSPEADRPRRIRFGLKSLLALMAVLAILCTAALKYSEPEVVPLSTIIKDFNDKRGPFLFNQSIPRVTETELLAAIRRELQTVSNPSAKRTLARIERTKMTPEALLDLVLLSPPSRDWAIEMGVALDDQTGHIFRVRNNAKITQSP